MRKSTALPFLSTVLALSAACSLSAPATPTATIPPTAPVATDTPVSSETPAPVATPTPTSIATEPTEADFPFPLPEGNPQPVWNEIPVMPGAIRGEERDGDIYVFTIQSSEEEVQDFYLGELPEVGWESLAVGEGGNGSVLMIFTGKSGTLSVGIFTVDVSQSLLFVMLLQS